MEATIIANSLANATSSTQEPLFAADIDLAVNIVSALNKYVIINFIIIIIIIVVVVVVVVVVVAAAAAAVIAVVVVDVTLQYLTNSFVLQCYRNSYC